MKALHPHVGNNIPSVPTTRLVGHEGPIKVIKFTHDGKYCVSAGHDRTIRLWNPTRIDPAYTTSVSETMHLNKNQNNDIEKHFASSKSIAIDSIPHALPIQSYSDGHTHPISSIDIDDTSNTLISSSNKTLVVTDVITQKLKRRFQDHTGIINSVTTSSDGSVFASGSYDGTVRLWDGRSFNSAPIQILSDASDSVSCVKFLQSDNGMNEIVSVSIDGCVRSYDIRKGCMNVDDFGKDASLTSISYTSDLLCNTISSLNGAIYVTERSTGEILNSCFGGHRAGRYSLECSITADDQNIISGSENGDAVIYNFTDGQVVQVLQGHSRATCSIATHPSREHSSVVITASYDGDSVMWTNGNPIYSEVII